MGLIKNKPFCLKAGESVKMFTNCVVSLESAPWLPRLGEIITLQDSNGCNYRGRVGSLSESECMVHIFESLNKRVESPLDILLLQALPDKERMEIIIQKATELGVNSIVPFFSERSTTLQEREKRQQQKAHRWPIIAKKAAQQCRRGVVPIIQPYTHFNNALLKAEDYDLKLLLWESEVDFYLNSDHLRRIEPPASICLIVGPEGGFTDEEVNLAKEVGFISLRLGPRILRTETAAIAIIAIVQYKWGDLG